MHSTQFMVLKNIGPMQTLNGIAAEISAATYGILPPALIKIAVILAIVMAESIYDIACLKVGMPVVIIKSKSTWHTKFGEDVCTDDKLKENRWQQFGFRFNHGCCIAI